MVIVVPAAAAAVLDNNTNMLVLLREHVPPLRGHRRLSRGIGEVERAWGARQALGPSWPCHFLAMGFGQVTSPL